MVTVAAKVPPVLMGQVDELVETDASSTSQVIRDALKLYVVWRSAQEALDDAE